LEKIVKGGDCIAHLNDNVYFVHYGLPGEEVIAEVQHIQKNIIAADVVEVIRPSAHRIAPPCEYFGSIGCGGCDFQHIELQYQRELKKDIIRQCLNFIGKLDIEFEVIPAYPQEDGIRWRNRIRLAANESGKPGMRQRRSHSIIPIDDCLISEVDLSDLKYLKKQWHSGCEIEILFSHDKSTKLPKVSSLVYTREINSKGRRQKYPPKSSKILHPINNYDIPLQRIDTIEKTFSFAQVRDFEYRFSPFSFFQIHKHAAELLLDIVLDYVNPQPGENGVDLYSGVGLFSLPLAKAVGESGSIVAVESNTYAAQDAEYNLRHIPQAKVIQGNVAAHLLEQFNPDFVVIDPPRSGIEKGALQNLLLKRNLTKIIYVSCDPATFARDAKIIILSGWDIKRFMAADIFPMTSHTETVAMFERNNN
jgi:23S rRNA (uracil-5-)-methyltransferase RumA